MEEAVAAGAELGGALVSPALEEGKRGQALVRSLEKAGVKLDRVSDRELAQVADTEQPQGIIALVRLREWLLDDLDLATKPAVLVLDGVQDPGNVGTLLRTTQGLGGAGVLALPGTVDYGNPKVVRGSMGALFSLPALEVSQEQLLAWTGRHSLPLLIAAADGEPIGKSRLPRPAAIVLGNEGAGVSAGLRSAGRSVAIPLAPGAESLNVAVAGGILLYEVLK